MEHKKENRLYAIWGGMKKRCENPKYQHYKYYGGKGISYCDDWKNYDIFAQWSINNGYDIGMSLDRIDNTKNYCVENCRWIPLKDQQKNKTNRSHLVINGIDRSYTEWGVLFGLAESTIRRRAKNGYKGNDLLKTGSIYGVHNPYIKKSK